jgi:AbrB family looped-hinge helix DNA binding protein
MSGFVTTVGKGGRVVVPAEYRAQLGLEPGTTVIVTLEDEGVQIRTRDQAVRRAQKLVRRHVPADVSLSDELIAERNAEARRESEEADARPVPETDEG